MDLFIDVQGGDILSSETGRVCPYFQGDGVACKGSLNKPLYIGEYFTLKCHKFVSGTSLSTSVSAGCLAAAVAWLQPRVCGWAAPPQGRGQGGVNGTLDGRGAVKNYYIQVPFQAPRHFSFHTGFEGRSGSIGKHLIVLQCDTIYFCCCWASSPRQHCAMAKGEGGEQYSNASLLNKPVSPDGIKLARKVSSRLTFRKYNFFYLLVLNLGADLGLRSPGDRYETAAGIPDRLNECKEPSPAPVG